MCDKLQFWNCSVILFNAKTELLHLNITYLYYKLGVSYSMLSKLRLNLNLKVKFTQIASINITH